MEKAKTAKPSRTQTSAEMLFSVLPKMTLLALLTYTATNGILDGKPRPDFRRERIDLASDLSSVLHVEVIRLAIYQLGTEGHGRHILNNVSPDSGNKFQYDS